MSILLSLLLSQAKVLPEIDRRALALQARAEALAAQAGARRPTIVTRRPTTITAQSAPARRTAPPAAAPVRRAAAQTPNGFGRSGAPVLRRASGGAFDLASITSICRAAGNENDPGSYIAGLSRAYNLNGSESSSLRTSCAAYLAGRADARVNSYAVRAR
jgi:hypothetical protein